MRKIIFTLLTVVSMSAGAQQLAFPEAVGFGRFATGGRTGTVYHVTNLNDSGTGSFRDAVSKPNRIIVFDVAGVIRINSRISVSSNLYIAGQTAPGEGITVYGNGLSFSGASNTICRYLRIRMGAVGDSGKDALGIANGSNMIFDHCSIAWGRDETFSISGDSPENITIQNSIISQGLMGHSAGGLVQTDRNVTIYRTLYIHNDTRNPKFKGTHQYVNNIVYNWKTAAYIMGGDSEGYSYANATGNLFITGPTGKKNAFSGANERYNIYADDNMIDNDMDGKLAPTAIEKSDYQGGPTFVSQPYDYPSLPTVKAEQLFNDLVPTVGACLPYRDNLDNMLIADLKSLGTEGDIISDESTLDIGSPASWNVWKGNSGDEKRKDSDADGMPDWWETSNGTNANANDAMVIRDGYANIEHYINSITDANSQYFLKAPVALKATERTQTSIKLKWRDFSNVEDGYTIEMQTGTGYTEIGRTTASVDSLTVDGLAPQTEYFFRVRAFKGDEMSDYSNTLSVKTKAKLIDVVNPDDYNTDLTWTGESSSQWNTSDKNWAEGTFADGKKVLFQGAEGSETVSIPAAVSPASVMIKGGKDYLFDGVIAGNGSLNMAGTGVTALKENNTYSGGTVVWSGILEVSKLNNGGNASSIGTAPTWVWNGGTVRYTGGSASTDRDVALQNTSTIDISNSGATLTQAGCISGEGDLIKKGAGTLTQDIGLHTYSGNTIVREGTYELRGKDLLGSINAVNGKLILEGGRFRTTGGDNASEGYLNFPVEVNGDKTSYFHIGQRTNIKNSFSGSGNLRLEIEYLREFYQGDWSNFFGNVTAVQKGSEGNQFHLANAGYGGIPNGRLALEGTLTMLGTNGKSYQIGAMSGTSTTEMGCCFIKTDGGTVTWKVGNLGTDETFYGKITNKIQHTSRIGSTSIVKEGEGYWRLTGSNNYRGTTDIMAGTLIINGSHNKDKDHTGTYFTPGMYTVHDEATLAGNGSTTAPVTVSSGGTIAPGDFGIGTLTIRNNITMNNGSKLVVDVNRWNNTNDKLVCQGTLTTGGTLVLNLTDGEYEAGDEISILSATTFDGGFSGIEPAVPGEGLMWDTKTILTDGKLRITNSLGIDGMQNDADGMTLSERTLLITPPAGGAQLRICAADGTEVACRFVVDRVCLSLNKGLYVVTLGGKTRKIAVR